MSGARVEDWVGVALDAGYGDVPCDRARIVDWCEATENGNPLFWDETVAEELTGGPVAPPTSLSVWMRPLRFHPGERELVRPLELHFRLKDAFDLPEGVVAANEIEFGEPVRPGDRVRTVQTVREIGEVTTTRLGTGRYWTIDVTYTNDRGDVVGIESYRMFCYRRPAAGADAEVPG